MAADSKHKNTDNRRENPASHFTKPSEVANGRKLSHGDKEEALNTWEQDARQLLMASNEGMTASDEGNTRDGVYLDDVVRAKETIC
jgi:hypothetical protein